MNRILHKLVFLILTLSVSVLYAQIPSGYYDAAQGKTGEQLKVALHNIIKGHKEFSYGDLWNILSATDEDPQNHNNVILIYTGISRAKTNTAEILATGTANMCGPNRMATLEKLRLPEPMHTTFDLPMLK